MSVVLLLLGIVVLVMALQVHQYATTDPQKVPETIHSRCQRFDFRRISNESIVSRLGAVCVGRGRGI